MRRIGLCSLFRFRWCSCGGSVDFDAAERFVNSGLVSSLPDKLLGELGGPSYRDRGGYAT